MPAAAIAPLMRSDAPAAVEHLDRAGRDADVDLLADQRMRHRVEEALDLDVIVEPDPGETPLGELVVRLRQRLEGRPLDAREQVVPADAKSAPRLTCEFGIFAKFGWTKPDTLFVLDCEIHRLRPRRASRATQVSTPRRRGGGESLVIIREPATAASSRDHLYLARTHDPPPGNKIMWRGWSRLADIKLGAEMTSETCG